MPDKPTSAETLGSRLRELREAKGLKQREVAAEVGIDQMQISRWERGITKPHNPEHLAQLAEALGTTVDYLLRGSAPREETVDRDAEPKAAEIRTWPAIAHLVEAMAGEEPTDEELEEIVTLAAFHRGSRGDADMRLVMGMRDAIRGMRTAMTPEQAAASREATGRHRDPSVPLRRR